MNFSTIYIVLANNSQSNNVDDDDDHYSFDQDGDGGDLDTADKFQNIKNGEEQSISNAISKNIEMNININNKYYCLN